MIRRAIATAVLLAPLAACGGGSEGGGGGMPKCDSVWKVGKVLPKSYEGCIDSEGAVVPGIYYDCEDGSKLTGVDEPEAFARLGGKVEASTDETYSAEFDDCKGL